MKKGINFVVRSVSIDSSARPLSMVHHEGKEPKNRTYTESMPTQLSIQKITKPPWPNLMMDVKIHAARRIHHSAYFRVKSSWKATLSKA